ncbi:MAG: hypothetical protein OXI87_22085 [Albidovulum sp.]|nr:hypothetical protein [Albidovulum sp.]MDE0534462.1 hypothetical protein [Albidovulum sp.]
MAVERDISVNEKQNQQRQHDVAGFGGRAAASGAASANFLGKDVNPF